MKLKLYRWEGGRLFIEWKLWQVWQLLEQQKANSTMITISTNSLPPSTKTLGLDAITVFLRISHKKNGQPPPRYQTVRGSQMLKSTMGSWLIINKRVKEFLLSYLNHNKTSSLYWSTVRYTRYKWYWKAHRNGKARLEHIRTHPKQIDPRQNTHQKPLATTCWERGRRKRKFGGNGMIRASTGQGVYGIRR